MPDYSNLAMVKDGVISRDPVLDNLYGLTVQQLGDESVMTQFDFIAEGRRWYPIVDRSPPLQRYQSYDGDGMLSHEPGALEVTLVRTVRDWTAQEIHDFKVNSIRHITKLAFRNRFTQAEKIAFEMAQVDDPTATQDVRLAAAAVRVLEKDLAASAYADMNNPAVQAGLHQLEAIGVLGAGRAEEIIWGDIEPYEVP
jgi:hypothetical protein